MNLAAIPVVTRLLTISIVAVFAGSMLLGAAAFQPTSEQLLKLGADYGPYNLQGEWWRAVTAMFLHMDLLHLAFNAWALLNLGSFAETCFGRRSFSLLYFASGIVGSMVSVWWEAMRISVGASGAIFGIAGALVAALYFRKVPIDPAVLKKEQKQLTAVVVLNLAAGAVIPMIDNAAHVGGLLAGLACGILLPMKQGDRSREEAAAMQRSTLLAVAVILIVTALGFAARSRHRPLLNAMQASELFENGRHEQAMKLVNSAIQSRPNLAFAYVVRGYGYVEQEAYPQAIADFRKALSLEPMNTQAMYQLGHAYRLQNQNQMAIEQLSELLKLQPEDHNAIAELGRAYLQISDPQSAIELMSGAVRREDHAELRVIGGRAYIAAGELDPAIIWLAKAVELEPDNAEAHTFLGEAYRKKGMKEHADTHFRKAGELRQQMQ